MSKRERDRLTILAGVKRNELTLVQASELLELGYRQTKRVWRRYQDEGDAGLVHRLRGKPSPRRKPDAVRTAVLKLHAEKDYSDFGPTLLAEHLERRKIAVDHETVRRWLIAEKRWTVGRRRQQHRQWRERKACFGQMVQLDGSHHDWFEGRRAKCVLMVMVDDATGRVWAQFFEEETTHASYDVFEGWVRQHGLPRSLYVDRDSIYRCEGRPSVADQLAGKDAPQTQFERAMERLEVKLILANSPQAKGRVERMNQTLQDRLVKELRLAKINDLESANRFLQRWLKAFNRRFARAAASEMDLHRGVPRGWDEVLSWEEERVVQRDWTVACGGKWYQLDQQHERDSLVGRKVIVRTLREGQEQLERNGRKLKWRKLPARPQPAVVKALRSTGSKPVAKPLPEAEHPWRRFGAAVGVPYWRGIKKQKRAGVLGAPIRAGEASPLRVATGGDANWVRKTVPAARPPARIDGAITRPLNMNEGDIFI